MRESSDTFADAALQRYLAWRQASASVSQAYGVWTHVALEAKDDAFAAYLAALDHEEHAAELYRCSLPPTRPRRARDQGARS